MRSLLAEARGMTRSAALRIGLPALVVVLALATPRAGSTATAVAGCPRGVPAHPVGSVLRVYAIPRGCVWLTIPQPEPSIPIFSLSACNCPWPSWIMPTVELNPSARARLPMK